MIHVKVAVLSRYKAYHLLSLSSGREETLPDIIPKVIYNGGCSYESGENTVCFVLNHTFVDTSCDTVHTTSAVDCKLGGLEYQLLVQGIVIRLRELHHVVPLGIQLQHTVVIRICDEDVTILIDLEVLRLIEGIYFNVTGKLRINLYKIKMLSVDSFPLNDTVVTLSTYGISITQGTPQNGDMINVIYTKASSPWDALGKDNDSLVKEMNPDVNKIKNILGKSVIQLNGYESEISIEPYYIDPSRKMYKRMLENAIAEKYGENDITGYFAEAFFTSANKQLQKMVGHCYVRKAWYIPQSTGGDTSALSIPVTIMPIGAITEGSIVYSIATNEAVITLT